MVALDFRVAQASFLARQMERALHDPGPWTVSWGPFEIPACRMIGEDRIVFLAHFPSHCYLAVPETPATLLCRGEFVGAQDIEFPGDGEFELKWVLSLEQSVDA